MKGAGNFTDLLTEQYSQAPSNVAEPLHMHSSAHVINQINLLSFPRTRLKTRGHRALLTLWFLLKAS